MKFDLLFYNAGSYNCLRENLKNVDFDRLLDVCKN